MVATVISGGDKLEAHLKELSKRLGRGGTVRIGFLESATYPNGTPVATVAAINNFGAPGAGIPPRPFFSDMVRDKSPAWGGKMAKVLEAVGYDTEKALNLFGEGVAGQLRQAIVDMNLPPNSPVTNLLKQRFPNGGQTFADVLQARADVDAGVQAPAGKPLVQSGTMLNSVGVEVTT